MEGTTDNDFEKHPAGLSAAEIKEIYKTAFPGIKNLILNNSGTIEDAKDVFQEAIMLLYLRSISESFKITSSTCTYLAGIARNVWLKKLRDRKKGAVAPDLPELSIEEKIANDDLGMWRKILLTKYLSRIGDQCKDILILYFEGVAGENIAIQLKFKSYDYYRVAKKRCIDKLTSFMQNDKLFSDLKM